MRSERWGQTNRIVKGLMLEHAFGHVDTVWLHIAPTNLRSQKACEKLGAVYSHNIMMDVVAGAVDTMCYRLDRTAWEKPQ